MFSKIFGPPDLSLTDEEVALRRKLQRRVALWTGIGLLLLAVLILCARPAGRAIHGWQARRHAVKAFALIDQQQWGPARDEAIAAYHLRSTEPLALRAVAQLFSRAGHPEALKFWQELRRIEKLTRNDLREEAAVALKVRDLSVAQEAVNELVADNQQQIALGDWLLAAQLEVSKQDFDKAGNYIRRILDDPAVSGREQLQAILLLDQILDAKPGADHTEVIQKLTKLARGSGESALNALVSLTQRILLKRTTVDDTGLSVAEIVDGLEKNPAAKPQHKLLATDFKMAQPNADHEALLAGAIEQFKNGDQDGLIALATWLNGHGEYQRELDTISLDRSLQTRDLFFQHVDALGALGRWDEIRRLIESEKFPLDPVVEHMYLARCFAQLGQTNGAENNWQRALEAAAGDPAKLLTLAEYAEKNGALETAGAAYEAAASVAPGSRQIQQSRLRVAYARLDTRKIYAALADLLEFWPNDTAVQNDEAYIRLLLLDDVSSGKSDSPKATDIELNAVADLAQKLIEREPNSLPHRTLLALARLKRGRTQDALAVYKDISVAPGSLTPSALAVHAAVLAAAGQETDAATERGQLPMDRLLPEERALIERR